MQIFHLKLQELYLLFVYRLLLLVLHYLSSVLLLDLEYLIVNVGLGWSSFSNNKSVD